jgi:hypothetical protein
MLRFSANELRNEQKISNESFYWTIHEKIHFMIFTSRSEDDIKMTNKRIEIDIEALYFVNRNIQINLDVS